VSTITLIAEALAQAADDAGTRASFGISISIVTGPRTASCSRDAGGAGGAVIA
jgi:hypothetical protein